MSALVFGEVGIMGLYVLPRGYTEIDWRTYIEQVTMVAAGERHYDRIRGSQGPLVYPAGFVWLYWGLLRLTAGGEDIATAQRLFAALFVLDSMFVSFTYKLAFEGDEPTKFPAVLLALLAMSRRAHSVFALRLFNDAPCTTLAHIAIIALTMNAPNFACVIYSLAVSVKMSALLYAPAWYVVLASRGGHLGAIKGVAICAFVQVAIAAPFLIADPRGYVARAFDIGRGFKHKWSVNFKYVPCERIHDETDLADCEGVFTSTMFKVGLLLLHAVGLIVLAHRRWRRKYGGFLGIFPLSHTPRAAYSRKAILVMLFSSNFVGLVFARSLHFQFCVWYVKSLPLLVFATKLPLFLKLSLLATIEAAWNPWRASMVTSTATSSLLLTLAHAVLFFALLLTPDVPDFLATTIRRVGKFHGQT